MFAPRRKPLQSSREAALPFSETPDRIAIFRALQLGDLLCAVPAWRALRRTWPHAHITLIGLPWAAEFVRRFRVYLDNFIEFPGFPGLPERAPDAAAIPAFLHAVRERRFDLALQMHGDGTISNLIVPLFGARMTAGFARPGAYRPDDRWFCVYPDGLPEIRRHLRLIEHLGIPVCGEHLEFPLTREDQNAFDALDEAAALRATPYACVHPGGRGLHRRWPAERFAEVADALADRGLTVVLTGTAAEAPLGRTVSAAMRGPAVNLIGRTDLGALGVLLSRARLLVANDTGVSHVAAALGVPSVILCTESDPVRWGPLDRKTHRVLPGPAATPAAVLAEVDTLGAAGTLATAGVTP